MKYLFLTLIILPLCFAAVPAAAIGSGSTGTNLPKQQRLSPEQLATARHTAGMKHYDKAVVLEQQAIPNNKQSAKLKTRAAKEYDKAIGDFEKAIKLSPRYYQAHISLGDTLRKIGRHEESVAAYDELLRINPTYAEAIKNRAQVYLDLNRLEDAKQAYLSLADSEPGHATDLLGTMMNWLAAQRDNTSELDQELIDQFARWVDQHDDSNS